MKLQAALLMFLFIFPGYAQVVNNKGPIFNHSKASQRDLISYYSFFRIENYLRDKVKAESLGISYYKQLLTNKSFKLPFKPRINFEVGMQVIANRIADNYKDPKTGKYINSEFLEVNYGLCMGYTITLRQFHYFAFFDSSKVVAYDKKKNLKEWRAYYQKLIDNVFESKPTVIPGFKSLFELSQSEIGDYLQRHIADQWAVKNVNAEGILNWALPLPRLTKRSISRFKDEIDHFLTRNFEPIVIFYDDTMFSSYAHVKRAISTSGQDEEGCFTLLTLDTDGGKVKEKICPGRYETKVEIAPNETLEFTDYYWSLKNFCKQNKALCLKH